MSADDITELLRNWSRGDRSALDQMLPLVYTDLKRLARIHLHRERDDNTLQATALVHEAYIRLTNQKDVSLENRTHFFYVASQLMRRILVDYARKRQTSKRGGAAETVAFDEAFMASDEKLEEWIVVDEAIDRFSTVDAERARLVEMRYFGGYTLDEIAELEGRSLASVKRDWAIARSWLHRALKEARHGPITLA